jgi:hypothetical protein
LTERDEPAGLIRSLNEGIAMVAESLDIGAPPSESWTFRCECGESGCGEWVELDLGHYRTITGEQDGRVLAPGHPVAEARRVRAEAQELAEESRALKAQARQQVGRSKRIEPPD